MEESNTLYSKFLTEFNDLQQKVIINEEKYGSFNREYMEIEFLKLIKDRTFDDLLLLFKEFYLYSYATIRNQQTMMAVFFEDERDGKKNNIDNIKYLQKKIIDTYSEKERILENSNNINNKYKEIKIKYEKSIRQEIEIKTTNNKLIYETTECDERFKTLEKDYNYLKNDFNGIKYNNKSLKKEVDYFKKKICI